MAAFIVSHPDGNGNLKKTVIAAGAISSVDIEDLTKSVVFEIDGGSAITVPLDDETVVDIVDDDGNSESVKATAPDLAPKLALML